MIEPLHMMAQGRFLSLAQWYYCISVQRQNDHPMPLRGGSAVTRVIACGNSAANSDGGTIASSVILKMGVQPIVDAARCGRVG
jgi:hypothetical protein